MRPSDGIERLHNLGESLRFTDLDDEDARQAGWQACEILRRIDNLNMDERISAIKDEYEASYSGSERMFVARVRREIENAKFWLMLETSAEVLPQTAAIGASQVARTELAAQIRQLADLVRFASDLTEEQRKQLLGALSWAESLISSSSINSDEARSDLQKLIGRSVAEASRGGAQSKWWKRIAGAVVLAEATFSLGLNVAAVVDQVGPPEVEVESVSFVYELPPQQGSPSASAGPIAELNPAPVEGP